MFTSWILIPNCRVHSSGPGDGGGSPLKIWPGEQLLKWEREKPESVVSSFLAGAQTVYGVGLPNAGSEP